MKLINGDLEFELYETPSENFLLTQEKPYPMRHRVYEAGVLYNTYEYKSLLIDGKFYGFKLATPTPETFTSGDMEAFPIWLHENRWYSYNEDKGRWYYTFEQGTAISHASYIKNYTKTTQELLTQFISTYKKK